MEAEMVLFIYDFSKGKFVEDVKDVRVQLFEYGMVKPYINAVLKLLDGVEGEIDGVFDISDYKANRLGMLYYKLLRNRVIVEGFIVAPEAYHISKLVGGPLDADVYSVDLMRTHDLDLGLPVGGNFVMFVDKLNRIAYSVENDAGFRFMKGLLRNPQRRKTYELLFRWYGDVYSIAF